MTLQTASHATPGMFLFPRRHCPFVGPNTKAKRRVRKSIVKAKKAEPLEGERKTDDESKTSGASE